MTYLPLLGVIAFLSVSSGTFVPEKRLIQTSEKDPPQWFTQDEIVSKLIRHRNNFMDVTDDLNRSYQLWPKKPSRARDYPKELKQQTFVNEILPNISIPRMESFIRTFSNFNNRFYISKTGVQSTEWLLAQINETFSSSGYSQKFTLETFKHTWPQPQESIIARIVGNDPARSSELIILGSHLDTINKYSPILGQSPGADDNGSGSVVLLETLRLVLASGFVPKRTIEFHWYAAEEVGLRGSQAIAYNYRAEGKNVYAMSNFDVVGYTKSKTRNLEQQYIGIITDHTDSSLNEFIRMIVGTYCTSKWKDDPCGYACTDHASWNKNGFPAASPVEFDFSPYMHTPKDTTETINFPYMAQFVRLAIGLVVELGEPIDVIKSIE